MEGPWPEPATASSCCNAADLRDRGANWVRCACGALLAEPCYGHRGRLSGARLWRDDRVLHSLPVTLDGKRRPRLLGGKGQDQPADPPPRRGRSAVAPGGGRQCDDGLDRSRQLVGRSEDQPGPCWPIPPACRGSRPCVPLFVKGALERGVSLTWAAKLMAANPARQFRLGQKGSRWRPARTPNHRAGGSPDGLTTRQDRGTMLWGGRPTTGSSCRGRWRHLAARAAGI